MTEDNNTNIYGFDSGKNKISLNERICVLEGTVTALNMGLRLDYPDSYNVDNCVVVSVSTSPLEYKIWTTNGMYKTVYFPEYEEYQTNQVPYVLLKEKNISVINNTHEDIRYKIVLIKID